MKEDQRGKVIDYLSKHKDFPRNKQGDVCFDSLFGFTDEDKNFGHNPEGEEYKGTVGVLQVFTYSEVCVMVNRFLYQMEYQRTIHRQREREKTEALAPLKAKVKEMFGVPWTKATEAQIEEAARVLKGEQG